MTTINYRTWKVKGSPTPNETLYICDACGTAIWAQDIPNGRLVCHYTDCRGRKGGPRRMRKGTAAETAEAKRHLETII